MARSKAFRTGSAGPFGFEVRPAWRRNDSQIEADAIEFWNRHDLLPKDADPEKRAKELIAAAYKDGRLVAVSTARIETIGFLKARMAVIRGSTDPDFRRTHAQLALSMPSRKALREWAHAHPEEKYAGGIVFVERKEWGEFARLPVWPESDLRLVGYDQHGRQIRVRWFEDFYYGDGPPPPPQPPLLTELPPGLDIRIAWRKNDPEIERDAIAFWRRLDILPPGASAEERAKELVLAAYADGQLIGLTTAEVGLFPQVRTRLAMLRGAVDPSHRRSYVGLAMYPIALETLENWAASNPEEKVTGVGGIIEAPQLAELERMPYWPEVRVGLIGFTADGRQIRVRWFRDALLD